MKPSPFLEVGWWCAAILVLGSGLTRAATPIPPDLAKAAFTRAHDLAAKDGGALWGKSLEGPMLFVDPETRFLVANQKGPGVGVRDEDGIFTGNLPAEIVTANTSIEVLGTRWTEILWPLPEEADERSVMLMHESFHRIQPALGFDHFKEVSNAQLDTLEGRYLLRLEWTALTRALLATDAAACKSAVADALLFRAGRQVLFSNAYAEETELERNEGVAEYTGVCLGLPDDPAHRARYTVDRIALFAQLGSYVRSFAYATGPAYGLLLDRFDLHPDPAWKADAFPTWRVEFKSTPDFARLLAGRAGVGLPVDVAAEVVVRAPENEGPRIRREEEAHEAHRQQILAADRQKLVAGPTLRIELRHMNAQFNPSTMRPLENLGTVCPTLRITDDWGVLEVTDGALLGPDWKEVTVAAPAVIPRGAAVNGPGWTLELKAGWKVSADRAQGNYRLAEH